VANAFTNIYRNNVFGHNGFAFCDLLDDTIKEMFVDHADDTPAVTDEDIADILSAARVPAIASCPALGTKTVGSVGAGVFDALDSVFPNLSGDQVESLIRFKDTGTEGTSLLIAIIDTATGLPLTPNGADVTVQHAAGGIFTS
jgi:hypothetical protein